MIIDDKTYNLRENDNIFIPKGSKHRLSNKGKINLIVIEMWYGDKLDENDIKRYEDIYKEPMIINTPVSLGELVDKISILHIKNTNIKDNEKLLLVQEILFIAANIK